MKRHLVSFPKSGRTWLRYAFTRLGVESDISFHHDGFEFNDGAKPPLNFDIDARLRRYAYVDKLVYLERDPRDVMVSLYHQVTGRFQDFFNYQLPISNFIRDPYFGAVNLLHFRKMWSELARQLPCIKITYEECHSDLAFVINRVATHFEFNIDSESILRAVKNADFSHMKLVESANTFAQPWLRPRNGSFKVRRGKIRGYIDELNVSDVAYLNEVFDLHE